MVSQAVITMKTKKINLGKDFSDTPLGRVPTDGPFSGERFRKEFLVPALRDNDRVIVQLDDIEGCGSSFLDEAFGGLVRWEKITAKDLQEKLLIESKVPAHSLFSNIIWKYIKEAVPRT